MNFRTYVPTPMHAALLGGLATLVVAAGCGPITFTDGNALVVVGEGPAPEPEPEPKPEPKAKLVGNRVEITEKVQFESAKATIKSDSFGLLDDVVTVLQENAQIEQISIEGHTDSVGPASYNQQLSRDRAKSVRKYLTEHGIDADRLVTKGWGEKNPIADNDTASGKAANRRVEFIVTKQGPGSEVASNGAQGAN